ncbi:hypothetical protein M409DRAFT_21864 [Zasmidium cellare ATCC 36951]|uniref:Non-structural maintenance of chromosomes element 1 homolog n=1 Tax=Zasmidium cellare ATCC 36951 TaxID=1080233 RepID=A0A6A6CKZ2_ZASCE|nr:uncharacterized protein M409DRAFT_21864 [Zasmidium cellare ATCC 36951]KAF2167711.1 hypothetical protein M409DRAFT_21864 [Zasmidium cellare ATCC 36951]
MSDDEDTAASYNNTQRAFLQALLTRQTITFEEAKPLLATILTANDPNRPTLEGDVTQEDFENYIHTINDTISPFDYEIRSSLDQVTRERIYALVNTTSDALTQMATVHTPDEIAFVKRVIDAMFDTNNTQRAEVFAVRSMDAVKLSKVPNSERRDSGQTQGRTQGEGAVASLTMSQAEEVLSSMVEEGWFDLSQKGYYSLTERSLMELRNWLLDMYNEDAEDAEDDEEPHLRIKMCAACRQIVTKGQRCPNLPCNVRLHEQCVNNMFRAQGGQRQCRECKTEWTEAPPVGEKAARNTGGRRPNDRRSTTNGTHDESDAGAGADD